MPPVPEAWGEPAPQAQAQPALQQAPLQQLLPGPPGLLTQLRALLQRLFDRWYVKALAVLGGLAALAHAVLNLQVVPSVNRHYVPQWTAAAQQLLHREVRGSWYGGGACVLRSAVQWSVCPLPETTCQ